MLQSISSNKRYYILHIKAYSLEHSATGSRSEYVFSRCKNRSKFERKFKPIRMSDEQS